MVYPDTVLDVKRLHRAGLRVIMTLAAINLFTGSPLAALWLGSRFVSSGQTSMTAVAVVAGVMFGLSLGLSHVLGAASARYDALTGVPRTVRRHTPWLRPMAPERLDSQSPGSGLTFMDRLLFVTVVLVILAFEVWFFFFSGSPFDQRTGRG